MKIEIKHPSNMVDISTLEQGEIFIYQNRVCMLGVYNVGRKLIYIVDLSSGDLYNLSNVVNNKSLLVTKLTENEINIG